MRVSVEWLVTFAKFVLCRNWNFKIKNGYTYQIVFCHPKNCLQSHTSDVKVCRTTDSRYTVSAYRSMYFDFIVHV